MGPSNSFISLLWASLIFLIPGISEAENSPDLGWSSSGRISVVHTEGNGGFTAIGVDLSFHHQWEESGLDLDLGAVLAKNQTLAREAVGLPEDFIIDDNRDEETIAENWSLSYSYQKNLSGKYIWVTHGGWERDEPGGIRNRYSIGMGLGIETGPGESCLTSIFSLTWNRQENLIVPPGSDPEFPGFRLAFGYERPVNSHTRFESQLSLYGNIEDLDDYRTDWTNALTISITDWLAFEAAAQWKYSSRPPLEEIPLLAPDRELLGLVAAPLDEHEGQISLAFVFQH